MAEFDLQVLLETTGMVVVNRRLDGVPAVLTTAEHGQTHAVEHLVALGHREVVCLAGPPDAYSNQQRRQALSTACRLNGVARFELGPFEPHFESGVRPTGPPPRSAAIA